MAAKKDAELRATKSGASKRKRGRPVKDPKRGKTDRSNAGRTARLREERLRQKALALQSGVVTAPPEAERVPQEHGGALLTGGVKGNRGGYISAARRNIRKRLLKALQRGGGVEFLERLILGEIKRTVVTKDGVVLKVDDERFRKEGVDTALKYGLGEISQHAIVNENDESIEAGVVELPMLDAAPVPPLVDPVAAAETVRATVRQAALDAATALIQAAK